MSITLKSNVIKIDATKIYPLKSTNRKFVNKKFDKLHSQDRMQFTT